MTGNRDVSQEVNTWRGNGAAPPPAEDKGLNTSPQDGPATVSRPSSGLTAASLRINPNLQTAGQKRLLTRVAIVARPNPQWYVQVHPDPAFRAEEIGLIEYHQDSRLYVVAPQISEELKSYLKLHYLFTATTIGGAVFLWVIKMPGEDGSWNAWPASLYGCANACMSDWMQIQTGLNEYVCRPADTAKPAPAWEELLYPCTDLDQLLDLGFRSTHINRIDHPVSNALLAR